MMKKMFVRKRRGKIEIPNASMSDIAFLLLIFFILTTTISVDKSPVVLPKSKNRTEIPKDHQIISVQKNSVVQFAGEPVMMADVQPLAAMEVMKDKERIFMLKADKGVQWVIMDELLEQMRKARARNLSMPTEQKTDSD